MALRFALLGDSIAHGQGASSRADTLEHRLLAGLRGHGYDVVSRVFAVRGARSAGLARQVDAAVGWHPDVALVVIGANDLTHLVDPHEAAHNLGLAVRRLREAGARVVVAPAPDLSVVPHVPPAVRSAVRAGSHLLRRLQTEEVLAAGGLVADRDSRTSSSFGTDPSLFSHDRFHPSSAGYAVIAGALLPVLLEAVAGHGAGRADG